MSLTRKLFLFLAVPLVVIFAGLGIFIASNNRQGVTTTIETTDTTTDTTVSKRGNSDAPQVAWEFDGQKWQVIAGAAPACPSPLVFTSPVDIAKVTGILYPGQERGGNYKPHGGFLFNASTDNQVTVKTPLRALVAEGSRYIEAGEVQYLFTFINTCGLAYRFDHLATLSPTFQKFADQLPEAKVDDSRTTKIGQFVNEGEVVATAVGFTKTKNVSLDFGVYNLRQMNKAAQNPTWLSQHQSIAQYAAYGVCWLDLLPAADAATLRALPASSVEGTKSDYCP